LNPGGVRIGTAEIYRIVENISGIEDSLVIGQEWKNDQRIILFLKMKNGLSLTTHVIEKIKLEIKEYCSPRHVPELILETKGIPYTINGKKVEIAVKKILHGEEVPNTDSLENPSVLDLYKDIKILSN
jgi:acetoacetyl-CoA synthetase